MYNMRNGDSDKKLLSDPVAQPTQPPQGNAGGTVDWGQAWNAEPQAGPSKGAGMPGAGAAGSGTEPVRQNPGGTANTTLPVFETREELREYLKQHPEARINGIDGQMLDDMEKKYGLGSPRNNEMLTNPTESIGIHDRPEQMSLTDLLKLSDEELDRMGVDRSQLENARAQQGMQDVEKAHYDRVNQETAELEKQAEDNWRRWSGDFVETALDSTLNSQRERIKGFLEKVGTPNGTSLQRNTKDMDAEEIKKTYDLVGDWANKLKYALENPVSKGIVQAINPGKMSVYGSEEEAAKAFREQAQNEENWETNEYASMMVTLKVPQTDEDGNTTLVDKTVLTPPIKGGERNVIIPVISQWAAAYGAENVGKMFGINVPVTGISFIHSHPEKGSGIINEFSNGDRAVGMLPGVTNMYRVNGDNDEIWRYNEVEEGRSNEKEGLTKGKTATKRWMGHESRRKRRIEGKDDASVKKGNAIPEDCGGHSIFYCCSFVVLGCADLRMV